MSERLTAGDRIRKTLDYYRRLGLVDPVVGGVSSIILQLEGSEVDLPLNDLDVFAAYTSIHSLADKVKEVKGVSIEEKRFSPKEENGIRDRAALKLLPDTALRASGIVDFQAFTGVETDRISLLYTDLKNTARLPTARGEKCLSVAKALEWKVLADRPKDRIQVPEIMKRIDAARAVSYDDWDEIRRRVRNARAELNLKHQREEQISWSAT